jgi:hypothetical protein
MVDKWPTPSEPAVRHTTESERAELLVDLLELADALTAPASTSARRATVQGPVCTTLSRRSSRR